MLRLHGPAGRLGRLVLAQLFINAGLVGMRMAAPLQSLRLGHGGEAVGCLIALFALSQVFLALPAGRYCERRGLKRPFAMAVAGSLAACALAAAWPVFPVLCLAALVMGAAGGLAIIAVQRHVPRIATEPAALRQAFSWLAIGLASSNVLGPLLAGLLIDAAGYRAVFAGLAALPLLAWLALRSLAEDTPRPPAAPSGRGELGALWRHAGLRRLLAVTCLLSCCWEVHAFLVPVLGNERGLAASTVGSVLAAFGAGAAAVRLLTPLVAARLRERVVLFAAMASTAVLFGTYPLVHSPLAMGACAALLGFSLGSTQPLVMTLLHRLAPADRYGEAVALRVIVNNASSVGIPLAAGVAGSLVGAAGVFWAAGLVVAAGARLTLGLEKR